MYNTSSYATIVTLNLYVNTSFLQMAVFRKFGHILINIMSFFLGQIHYEECGIDWTLRKVQLHFKRACLRL